MNHSCPLEADLREEGAVEMIGTNDVGEWAAGRTPVAIAAPMRPSSRSRVRDFRELTKPRMNFLVLVTTLVGCYMSVRGWGDGGRVIATLLGTALMAAGASVLNQVIERKFDALMPRTANRPLPAGRVRPAEAWVFGLVLAAGGMAVLAALVNPLTALLGAITVTTYLLLYTPAKRRTTLCTLIGAIPGAIPAVMGVTAMDGAITAPAAALFGILFVWQMPHFFAIAILYRDDYASGGFRMLPVIDEGARVTTRQIVLYSLALIPMTLLPFMLGMAGWIYLAVAVILGIVFCCFGINYASNQGRAAARHLFLASIVYLPGILTSMALDRVCLP